MRGGGGGGGGKPSFIPTKRADLAMWKGGTQSFSHSDGECKNLPPFIRGGGRIVLPCLEGEEERKSFGPTIFPFRSPPSP